MRFDSQFNVKLCIDMYVYCMLYDVNINEFARRRIAREVTAGYFILAPWSYTYLRRNATVHDTAIGPIGMIHMDLYTGVIPEMSSVVALRPPVA